MRSTRWLPAAAATGLAVVVLQGCTPTAGLDKVLQPVFKPLEDATTGRLTWIAFQNDMIGRLKASEADNQTAKRFKAVRGKTVLYIYAAGQSRKTAIATVGFNDLLTYHALPVGGFYRLELLPGHYRVRCQCGNYSSMAFEALAGQLVFIQLQLDVANAVRSISRPAAGLELENYRLLQLRDPGGTLQPLA